MSSRRASVAMALGAVCLTVVGASAADRYVAMGGVDAGDCSNFATPCASVGFAAGVAVYGDTVRVARGTYTESGIVVDPDITIQGGWDADFGSWLPDPWLTLLDGGGAAELVSSLWGTIQGLTLTNADTCIRSTPWSELPEVQQSVIAGCATAGIHARGTPWDAGNVLVANSVVVGNGTGIKLDAGGSSEFSEGIYLDLVSTTVSFNGTGIGLAAGGGFPPGGGISATITSSVVWGNSDVDVSLNGSGAAHISVAESYSDIGSVTYSPNCNVGYVWCTFTGTILNLDPLFAPDGHHLLPGSPCVDTASAADSPPVDYEGDARPFDGDGDGTALPDMGADEMTNEIFSDGFEVGDTWLWTLAVPAR